MHFFTIKKYLQVTYITLIQSCSQDAYSVLCIFHHVLLQVMKDFPKARTIFDRSDNAGYYASASVIVGKAKICDELGMTLVQTEFNEPQCGKDQCDRDVALVKTRVTDYLNCGHDVCTVDQIFEGIMSNGGR
jgi:hypothetical protein